MEERKEYNRKIKLYERLGAVKFQKFVFAIERAKFKIIKKAFPKFLIHFDKYCDKKKRKEIKKAKSKEDIKRINKKYKNMKMAMRKEFYQEKNRNYHLNTKNPTETYDFLKWNKSVHERNLKINFALISLLVAGVFIQPVIALPLLAIELFSAGINFECINIQNYNICRYKKAEKALLKRAERSTEKRIQECGEATEIISTAIEEAEDLPTFDEIIDKIKNKEQLEQMKNLILEAQRDRANEKNRGLIK